MAAKLKTVKVDEPWMGYDYIARIPIQDLGLGAKIDERTFLKKAEQVFALLNKGLADRATHLNILLPKASSLDLKKGSLDIGIVAEPGVALRAVDRGPEQEQESETRAFQDLWGAKAELRRFKDGAIQESVVWKSTDAPALLHEIVQHLILTHVGQIAAKDLVLHGNDFNSIIPGFTSRLDVFDPISAAYQVFEKDLRSLDGLPLAIRQISPADSSLSSSTISLPFASKGRHAKPVDVVVQFESSARWPDDLQAIQMTKVAFLLKTSELMTQHTNQCTTRIGLENEPSDVLNRAFLDVSYRTGIVFRLRIHHDREQALIERLLKTQDSSPATKDAAAVALAAYKRTFMKRPTHCQALQALITRHVALSGTIRLVKRWFNAHLLGPHFPDELLEIMCMRCFVHAHPWKPPSSPQTGFFRTLLFLSRWSWQDTPLLVDYDGDAGSAALAEARTRFDAWRKIDPAMNRVALFAGTNLDTDGATWTERRPSKVVANRMTRLASAAMGAIQQQGVELDVARLFKASVKSFDVRINISKAFLPGKPSLSQATSKFKNLQETQIVTDNSMTGFEPVMALTQEINNSFGEVLMTFYDPDRPALIAGVWDPTKGHRRWKVNLAYSTIPVAKDDGEATAEVNHAAILNEISRLGGDMIASIDTNE